MTGSSDWMAGGGRGRQVALRLLALFLVAVGLLCLAFPIFYFMAPERAGLIDDTRAYLGAGTAESVPTVSRVSCIAQDYGPVGRRGSREWACVLDLAPSEAPAAEAMAPGAAPPPTAPPPSAPPPPPGSEEPARTSEKLFARYAEQNKRHQEQMDRDRKALEEYFEATERRLAEIKNQSSLPRIERVLATNRSGQIPTLRLLSASDEPARYGVIWGGGELALRWLSFGFWSILIIAFGAASLFAARVGWRRTRR